MARRKRPRYTRPTLLPTPDRSLRAVAPTNTTPALDVPWKQIQEQIRRDIWAYALEQNYNPVKALIDLSRSPDCEPDLEYRCHSTVASFLLPTLAGLKIEQNVSGEVEVHHTHELRGLFSALEEEEAQARPTLPAWTPPGLQDLDMRQQADGQWDVDEEGEQE
jgi:hypothetical protein